MEKMTKLLAFDISSRSLGWAGTTDNGSIQSGVQNFSSYTHDYGKLFDAYHSWLLTMVENFKPDRIVIEGTNNMLKGNARYLLTSMSGITHMVAARHNIPRREFAPATIKKFFTGNARASKEDMIAEAHKRGFTKVVKDDEADAIAILLLGEERLDD